MKLDSQNRRMIALLEQAGSRGISTAEWAEVKPRILRYSARLGELRHKHGYNISSEPIKGTSQYRYVLLSKSGADSEGDSLGGQPSGAAHTAPDLGEQSLSGRDSSSAHRVDGGSAGSPLSRPESDEQLFDTPKPKTHRGYGDMEAA